jgi:hypothetical protein
MWETLCPPAWTSAASSAGCESEPVHRNHERAERPPRKRDKKKYKRKKIKRKEKKNKDKREKKVGTAIRELEPSRREDKPCALDKRHHHSIRSGQGLSTIPFLAHFGDF